MPATVTILRGEVKELMSEKTSSPPKDETFDDLLSLGLSGFPPAG